MGSDSLDLKARLNSLERACELHGVEFRGIDEATVDMSSLPRPTEKDGLYNCARGSFLLEKVMINRDVRTFYRDYELLSQMDDSNIRTMELDKQNIPTPGTIHIGTNDKKLLNNYVTCLGGFPLIVKTYGGVSGVGVIKVDSYSSLISLADFLVNKNEPFQIKKYIKSNSCERVTVLGDKVLYSITRPVKSGEFRSDGYSKQTKKIELASEINDMAVKAAHAANLNFAGIDIVISQEENKAYVLEVNLPHNFVQHEKVTGEDYSRELIKWMFDK